MANGRKGEPLVVYNRRGAGDFMHRTSSRASQMFKSGEIPTTVLINGHIPAVDHAALEKVVEQRAASKQQRRRA